ncbi:MAG: PH domain-containing protein [Myxococcota bacterium]
MASDEVTLWEGHPSHVRDLGFYLFCLLTIWLVVPLFLMLGRYLKTRCQWYEVTSERIRLTQGVFSKRMDEIELYRVKDTSLEQPFRLRLFGRTNLIVKTSDASTGDFVIPAIPNARELRERLRGCVEKMRERKGVREVDYR